jgi:hypothetical protein
MLLKVISVKFSISLRDRIFHVDSKTVENVMREAGVEKSLVINAIRALGTDNPKDLIAYFHNF